MHELLLELLPSFALPRLCSPKTGFFLLTFRHGRLCVVQSLVVFPNCSDTLPAGTPVCLTHRASTFSLFIVTGEVLYESRFMLHATQPLITLTHTAHDGEKIQSCPAFLGPPLPHFAQQSKKLVSFVCWNRLCQIAFKPKMVCHLQNDGSGVCMCRSSFAEESSSLQTTRSHYCYYTLCAEEAVESERGQSFLWDSRDRKWCYTLWMGPRQWAERPFLAFVAHLTRGLASSDPAQDD